MLKTAALYKSSPSAEPQAAGVRLNPESRTIVVVVKGIDIHEFPISTFTKVTPTKKGLDIVVDEVSLEIRDVDFCTHLSNILGLNVSFKRERRLVWFLTSIPVFSSIIILGALIWGFFWGLPLLAEKSVELFPESMDKDLGKQFFAEVKATEKLSDSGSVLLQRFLVELDPHLANDIQLHYAISPVLNAYALPGTDVIVYSGLIDKIKTPEQLAALLAHEISHIKKRHTTRIMLKHLSSYVILRALLGESDGVVSSLALKLNELKSISYSRDNEKEADEAAFTLLRKWKLSPKGAVELFQQLKADQGSNEPDEMFNTHPALNDRIKWANDFSKKYSGEAPSASLKAVFSALKAAKLENSSW